MAETVQIVWFKRDLRVADHAPLTRAAAAGPVVALHVDEPEFWAQPAMSGRQRAFVDDCLDELAADSPGSARRRCCAAPATWSRRWRRCAVVTAPSRLEP